MPSGTTIKCKPTSPTSGFTCPTTKRRRYNPCSIGTAFPLSAAEFVQGAPFWHYRDNPQFADDLAGGQADDRGEGRIGNFQRSQFLNLQTSGHASRHELHDFQRLLADDVCADNLLRNTVYDQLAKADRVPVDDCTIHLAVRYHSRNGLPPLPRLLFGEANAAVFGISEAAMRHQ